MGPATGPGFLRSSLDGAPSRGAESRHSGDVDGDMSDPRRIGAVCAGLRSIQEHWN